VERKNRIMSSNKEKINESDFVEWDEILKEKNIDFIVNTPQLKELLKLIGNDIDDEGYIIDAKTGEREMTIDSDEIKLKKIGAILPGSKVYIKRNIASFSQYLSEYK